MRAVGYRQAGPVTAPNALEDIELPRPVASGRDLLVEVRAVSVNPVDTKVRRNASPAAGEWKVLGFDAAGVVVETGPDTRLFRPGDEVFYAGVVNRSGSNAEFQLVDERLVGRKPASLGFAGAAAMPLTALTAWETLFDRIGIERPVPGAEALLIIGGGGGVASIAVQLARTLTALPVIATASRPETREWATAMGAHHVVDHLQPMAPQIAALGLGAPGFVFSTTHTDRHFADIAAMIAPQGRFGLIDEPVGIDILALKAKAVSIHWESMFTRGVFATPDMERQHEILTRLASLVDEGRISTTLAEVAGPIDAAHLIAAHARIESGTTRGKIVLEGS